MYPVVRGGLLLAQLVQFHTKIGILEAIFQMNFLSDFLKI